MKRVVLVLVLLVSGTLIANIPFFGGEVLADDLDVQCLVGADSKEDLLEDVDGEPPDDGEGDPDTYGDGLGFDGANDTFGNLGLGDISDVRILEKLLFFLISSVWLVP